MTKTVVGDLAALVDESLAGWIDDNVDFATSMVDRITPVTNDDDRALVERSCGTSTPTRWRPNRSASG